MRWIIERQGFDPAGIADAGNRFLIGNGYMGVRGTLEEFTRDQLVAVNLAGIFHKAGDGGPGDGGPGDGWREPLNAPNPLFARLLRNGAPLALPEAQPVSHRQALDIRRGLHSRQTDFGTATVRAERFAAMHDVHLLAMRYEAAWRDDAEYALSAGIDADVWDIHGPHYNNIERGGGWPGDGWPGDGWPGDGWPGDGWPGDGWVLAATDAGQRVAVAVRAERELRERSLCYTVIAAVYTSNDVDDPLAAARAAAHEAPDYEALRARHEAEWAALWARAEVAIEGDAEAETAMNYSIYHLLSIAPRHAASLSVPARGLSGQMYKGAVFWDTEMFMLDFYLAVLPEVARATLRYRIDTLPGALEKARGYGYRGAFYAWESQEGGYDACSDYNVTDVFTGRPMRTYFRDRQFHVTAAVVYGLCKYQDWTGDDTLMEEGGLRVLVEAARFYQSLLTRRVGLPGASVPYDILGAVGPDEYHERVDNNAYTNEMARMVLRETVERLTALKETRPAAYDALDKELGFAGELPAFAEAVLRIKRQAPDARGVIEQFDGYFALEDATLDTVRGRLKDPREYWGGAYGVAADTQVIKQADVIALLYLMRERYTPDVLRANYDYYEPRTEHGSSLSACMYALVACLLNRVDDAYPLFLKSAGADLVGGGKQWAGLVYIGGTHPAAAGGAYMVLLHGFLGMEARDGQISLAPRLPRGWTRVSCRVNYRGKEHVLVAER